MSHKLDYHNEITAQTIGKPLHDTDKEPGRLHDTDQESDWPTSSQTTL